MKLENIVRLNENKIIDRRTLKAIEKALSPLGRGTKLTKAEESPPDSVEGEGTFEKKPNSGAIKKAEKALERLGFDFFLQGGPEFQGQTVGGAEIEVSRDGKTFTFFIEFFER